MGTEPPSLSQFMGQIPGVKSECSLWGAREGRGDPHLPVLSLPADRWPGRIRLGWFAEQPRLHEHGKPLWWPRGTGLLGPDLPHAAWGTPAPAQSVLISSPGLCRCWKLLCFIKGMGRAGGSLTGFSLCWGKAVVRDQPGLGGCTVLLCAASVLSVCSSAFPPSLCRWKVHLVTPH